MIDSRVPCQTKYWSAAWPSPQTSYLFVAFCFSQTDQCKWSHFIDEEKKVESPSWSQPQGISQATQISLLVQKDYVFKHKKPQGLILSPLKMIYPFLSLE